MSQQKATTTKKTEVISKAMLLTFAASFAFLSPQTAQSTERMNVRIQQAPFLVLGLLSDRRVINVDVMFPIIPHLNLGASALHFNSGSEGGAYSYVETLQANHVGVRADLMFSGNFQDSFYVTNAVFYGFYKSSTTDNQGDCVRSSKASGQSVIAAVTGGYHWFFEGGLNANLGFGVAQSKAVNATVTENSTCPPQPGWNPHDGRHTMPWFDVGIGFAF